MSDLFILSFFRFKTQTGIKTTDCLFNVEFHLPSGGDTGLIDKQFIIRIRDSVKTLKLILVSPRLVPSFKTPDIADAFDIKELSILVPLGATAAGLLFVLILIFIYGYKTKPKDQFHRDRDNGLHFRHILYVVWFVGLRLAKSFLLTFTVFSFIFTAVHFKNVKTLGQYKYFQDGQDKAEKDLISLMDEHRVVEINRQMKLVRKGKESCNAKLKELNNFLEAHFKLIKARQEEEIRKKSIILTAVYEVKGNYENVKTKLEEEIESHEIKMNAFADEINAKLGNIKDNIENSFWLKAAKILYETIKALANLFGESMDPFIKWVGLDISFPTVKFELNPFASLFDQFSFEMKKIEVSDPATSFPDLKFQARRHNDMGANVQELSPPEVNISSPASQERVSELLALEWILDLAKAGVFSGLFLILDILWFIYRKIKTYQLVVFLLHGFPKYYTLEKIKAIEKKKKNKKRRKEEIERKRTKRKQAARKEASEESDSSTTTKTSASEKESTEDQSRYSNDPTEITEDKNRFSNDPIEEILETKHKTSNAHKAASLGVKGLYASSGLLMKVLVKIKQLNYKVSTI